MSYIDIPIVADTDVLVQQALTSIADNIPGWIPREGNLEVLLIEQFAAMAAEAATVASGVPTAIFEYFGSLVGVTPNAGTQAEIQATWTLVSAAPSGGYTIPAGTIAGFFYSGAAYQFQTEADLTIAAGSTSGVITMQSVAVGSIYNIQNLANFNPLSTYLQPQNSDPNVASVLVTATSAQDSSLALGTDPEPTDSFLNRLTAELQLLAPRPITPSDYALFAQNVAGVYRSIAFDGFNPFTNRQTAANANMTTYATSGSAPAGWFAFGNGSAALPTLSTPGTSPNNYLQVTTASTAMPSAVPVNAVTPAGSISIVATVGTGTAFSTTIGGTSPTLAIINDSVYGNEVVSIAGASATSGSGASTIQTLSLGGNFTSFNGTAVSGSPVLTVSSAPANLYAGQIVNSSAFPSGTTVLAIGTTTITFSANATSSGSVSVSAYTPIETQYYHDTNATITLLQGAVRPATTGLADNSFWRQAASIVEAGTAPSGATTVVQAQIIEYVDGSARIFSSVPQFGSPGYDYTSGPKTIVVNSQGANNESPNALAYDPGVSSTYQNLKPYMISAQGWIGFETTSTATTHKILYNSGNMVPMDLGGVDDPLVTTSEYNFVPDALFSNYLYSNAAQASWGTMPSGVIALPGSGVQFQGTGSALGSPITISSQIFNLNNHAVDGTGDIVFSGTLTSGSTSVSVASIPAGLAAGMAVVGAGIPSNTIISSVGTSTISLSNAATSSTTEDITAHPLRTFTLTASIDASYTIDDTYGDITVQVYDVANSAVLANATVSPTAATFGLLTSNFVIGQSHDVQVQIVFEDGLYIPTNSSAIVSQIGVLSGSYTPTTIPSLDQNNYAWTPGGLYDPNTFNYPRTVTVSPIDVNGLPVSSAISETLTTYLQNRREVNFTVQSIGPSYIPIDVQWSGYISPGYVSSNVQSAANAAIREFLSPANWAGGQNSPPFWDGSATAVRIFDIAGVILSTPGVASVTSVQTRLSYPTNGAYSTTDITLTGVAPLPIANTISGTIYSNAANAYSGLG